MACVHAVQHYNSMTMLSESNFDKFFFRHLDWRLDFDITYCKLMVYIKPIFMLQHASNLLVDEEKG